MVSSLIDKIKNCGISLAISVTTLILPFFISDPSTAGILSEAILFSMVGDHNKYELYKMRPDGNELKKLTNIPLNCREPNICSINNKVAFSALKDKYWSIFCIDTNTLILEELISNCSDNRHPVWSPDGSKIAFETDRWGQSELAIYDLASKKTERLTFNQCINRYPSWSPDGKYIAYTSWADGIANIFALRLNADNLLNTSIWNQPWQVDPLVENRLRLTKSHYPCTRPKWNQNSEKLVFEMRDYKHRFLAISGLSTKASDITRLQCKHSINPAWSPDGKWILYNYQENKKNTALKLYDVKEHTISDFPRQFKKNIYDIVWQRCRLPWSIEDCK